MELYEAFDGWVLELRARRNSAGYIGECRRLMVGTADKDRRRAKRTERPAFFAFCNELGVAEVEQLNGKHLKTYIVDHLSPLSSATQRGMVARIKAWSKWLEEDGIVQIDPFRKVKRPSLDEDKTPRERTLAEIKAILGALDPKDPEDFRDSVIIKLALDVGLRRAEICGIDLGDVNLEEGWIKVTGKGRKKRLVPISDDMKTLLWKYEKRVRAKRAKPGVAAFFVTRRGTPLLGSCCTTAFRSRVSALASSRGSTTCATRRPRGACAAGCPKSVSRGCLGTRTTRSRASTST